MLASPSGGQPTFYYLSTGYGSERISERNRVTTPADLDGDHLVDYVYAGDIQGNVWRFDLTSQNPSNWTVIEGRRRADARLFVAERRADHDQGDRRLHRLDPEPPHPHRVRNGLRTSSTKNAPTYATTQQYLIGVWDWNMSAWNAMSNVTYDALSTTTTPLAPTTGRCSRADQRPEPAWRRRASPARTIRPIPRAALRARPPPRPTTGP